MTIRKFITALTVAATALAVTAGLTGCSMLDDSTNTQYVRVCESPDTGLRVPDAQCGTGTNALGGFAWYYLLATHTLPGVGYHVAGGSYTYPKGYSRSAFVKAPTRGGKLPSRYLSGSSTSNGYKSKGGTSGYKGIGSGFKSGGFKSGGGFHH